MRPHRACSFIVAIAVLHTIDILRNNKYMYILTAMYILSAIIDCHVYIDCHGIVIVVCMYS
jgi:hypothetical protein